MKRLLLAASLMLPLAAVAQQHPMPTFQGLNLRADPTGPNSAVRRSWVDGLIQGLQTQIDALKATGATAAATGGGTTAGGGTTTGGGTANGAGTTTGGGTTTPPPASSGFVAQVPRVPNVQFQIDAAMPASTSAIAPGIQIDSANNVNALYLPGGITATNGFGKLSLATGGLGGRPYFHGDSNSFNNGYDGIVLPIASARVFMAGGQQFAMKFVMRQIGPGSNDLFRFKQGNTSFSVFGRSGVTDCSFRVEQNNGSALGDEPSSPLTACGQAQIIEVLATDRITIIRNGQLSFQSDPGAIGGLSPDNFEFLNNPQADTSYIQAVIGIPSRADRVAEDQRLASLYGIQGVVQTTTGPVDAVPPTVADQTATFLSVPNFPITDTLPTDPSATIGNGLALTSGATQTFSMKFGTGAGNNVQDGTKLRQHLYLNYMSGNQNNVFGSPEDNGQGNNDTFAAVARHYAVGDPNDVHQIKADGLHLDAICSVNRTRCTPGAVWAGMVRFPTSFKPGMTLKVTYKSPKGDRSWAPIWMFTGEMRTPGPGGEPFTGYQTPNALIRDGQQQRLHEIDWNDNFSRFGAGVATGHQIDFGTPNIYGTPFVRPQQITYAANGAGPGGTYAWHPGAGPDFLEIPQDWSAGFHTLVGNWRNDGTNLLDLFVDGTLVQQAYMEFTDANTSKYVDPNGVTRTVGMHLIIGNQAIPGFAPGASTAIDNDGIPDGWTIVVQEVSAWYGNVANPDSHRANSGTVYPLQ